MRYLLASVLLLSGCKWSDTTATTVASTKNTDTSGQDIAAAVSDISGEHVCPAKINVNSMLIDFLGAGVQTTKIGEQMNEIGHFVRLYYSAPLCRDYLEIMRCTAEKRDELTCRDGKKLAMIESTEDVQQAVDNPYGQTVNTDGFRDCWISIAKNSSYGCVVLGGVQDSSGDRTGRIEAAEHFIDVTAPAGQKFFYLARPCIDAERANELTSGNKNCSHRLYVSNVVKDFESLDLHKDIINARQKVADIAARLNYMTAKAYEITLAFSKALAKHETEDIKRRRNKNLRQGIAMIAGLTVGAAGAVYTVGVGSIGSGLDAGQALGSAFADIIGSKDDYPKTCTECMNLWGKLVEIVGEVDDASLSSDAADTGIELMMANDTAGHSLARGSGHIYQQALDEYEEALHDLIALQKTKDGYQHEAQQLDGSRGGPP